MTEHPYLAVLLETLRSASMLPGTEIRLMAMKGFGGYDLPLAVLMAIIGGMLGAVANWLVGYAAGRTLDTYGSARLRERRVGWARFLREEGAAVLLLSCMGFGIGTLITLAAGVLRVPMGRFLAVVLLGKVIWYGYWVFWV